MTSEHKLDEHIVAPGPGATEATVEPPFSIYSNHEKALIVTITSIAGSFSALASNIYLPCLPTIASDLSVSVELVNLTVTSYMISQGLSPTLWGAVADKYGRRVTYICTFLIFFAACVVLANTKDYPTLVALRCLQSFGSAATIAIGSGVLGDITTRSERGGFMGIFQAGMLVPLAGGPIIGGALSNSLGWRSIFWFLAIFSGSFLLTLVWLLPETLRALVGNGSVPGKGFVTKFPLAVYQRRHRKRSPSTTPTASADLPPKRQIDILGSTRVLSDRRVVPIIVFVAIYYAVWQMSITVMSSLFKSIYKLDDTKIGLTYIANGVGSMVGTISTGRILDMDYRRIKKKCDDAGRSIPLDYARLRTVWIFSAMQMSSILVFGWTLDKHEHISIPIICTFFISWALMSIQSMVSTYIVDVFPDCSASATAALNLARCLIGAGGTASALPIINAIGTGWGFTMLTAIMCAALGLIVLQVTLGKKWRETDEERKKEKETA